MSKVLENRIAIHALMASACSPKQVNGLFLIAVPRLSVEYFWRELLEQAKPIIEAAVRHKDEDTKRLFIKNGCEVRVLPNDTTNPWRDIDEVSGAIFYGHPYNSALKAFANHHLSTEPRGWLLVG